MTFSEYPWLRSPRFRHRTERRKYREAQSAPPFGAYQFSFTASFKISMTRACSATIFFGRTFSFCRALSPFAIYGCLLLVHTMTFLCHLKESFPASGQKEFSHSDWYKDGEVVKFILAEGKVANFGS